MPGLILARVSRVFPGGVTAVDRLDLEVADGELIALVGPSGSGKTTTLRLIAGLEPVTAGQITIGGRRVDQLPPRQRDVAISFQHHAIFPHLSVRENLAFGMRVRQGGLLRRMLNRMLHPAMARAQTETMAVKVREAAELLGLADQLERWPDELSGGQQQRVALGRALVRGARVLLLDEPLAHLDGPLRLELRRYLREWHQQSGTTTLYVTHDPVEALALADRVAVLDRGRICQVDKPEIVYRRPKDRFVAGFLCPTMNFLSGQLIAGDGISPRGGGFFCTCFGSLPVDNNTPQAVQQYLAKSLVLAVRPEDCRVRPESAGSGAVSQPRGEPHWAWLPGRVERIEREGGAQFARVMPQADGGTLLRARLRVHLEAVGQVQLGDSVAVGIDMSRALWFENDGGRAIVDDNV